MGNRTVVILYNDQTSEWASDATLGRKIMLGMNDAAGLRTAVRNGSAADLGYGQVVQCAHADTQTLAILDGYLFQPVIHSFWQRGEKYESVQIRLLREAAESLGYQLVKKTSSKD